MITGDDLGAEIGCYGDAVARTPNIDRFAEQGTLFRNGWVTQASCSPSRSSLLTGLYPHQSGQIGLAGARFPYGMREGLPTLPKLLRDAGYRTGILGKLHVRGRPLPFDYEGPVAWREYQRDSAAYAQYAREFIEQEPERPFFLYLNFIDPHRPLHDQVKGLPENPRGPSEIEPLPFLGVDSPKVREEVAGYYNAVERLDAGFGMVMDALEEAGVAENTLVILVGDHGAPFARAKASVYEAGVRIPYVLRMPGKVRGGAESDALVSTVDLMPTILALAGIEKPELQAGESLWPLLKGGPAEWRETMCGEFTAHTPVQYYPRRAIRDRRYKLIVNFLPDRPNAARDANNCAAWEEARRPKYDGTLVREIYERHGNPPAFELYDLQEDPVEFHNLADSPEHAETRERLFQALRQWQEKTADPLRGTVELLKLTKYHDRMDLQP